MEDLATFYQRIGQPAIYLAGGAWVVETRLSVMSTPGSVPLSPRATEVKDLLRRTGKIAAVFGCGLETGRMVNAFVVRDREYGMHSLQRQFRQQVKLALKECECRPVDWKQMATLALPVNQAVMARRRRHKPRFTEAKQWMEYCEAAAFLPGHQVMGCFVKGELAGYMSTWIHAGVCHGLQMLWAEQHRAAHPTHALYYETVRDRIARPDVTAMMVGRQPVPAMKSVDRFKRHAGFVPEPCRVGIVLRPGVSAVIAHPWTLRMFRALRQWAAGRWTRLHHTEVFEVAAETQLL